MKRSTQFLMFSSLIALVGLFSLPSAALAEDSSQMPTAQEINTTSNPQDIVRTVGWTPYSLPMVTEEPAGLQYYPATPVKFWKHKKKEPQCEACPSATEGDERILEEGGLTLAGPGFISATPGTLPPIYAFSSPFPACITLHCTSGTAHLLIETLGGGGIGSPTFITSPTRPTLARCEANVRVVLLECTADSPADCQCAWRVDRFPQN